MSSATAGVSPSTVRFSWDTQQRLPYNRNAPRKTNKPKSLSLSSSTSTSTSEIKQTSKLQINVNDLLKLNAAIPHQKEEIVNLESTYMGYERWLPSPPKVDKPRSSHNAASLAYVGDCIYELYARRHFLVPALNIEEYNDHVMAVVRCEAQDALLYKLVGENFLSDEERDVLRWGKNINSSKTRTTKRAGVAVYNRASSLETLIGYLYLSNPKRLDDMMSRLGFSLGISNRTILEDVKMELNKMKQKRPKEKGTQPIGSEALLSSVSEYEHQDRELKSETQQCEKEREDDSRWGPLLDQATYKTRQRLYLSEQTDGSVPNTLVIASVEVVKPRVAAAEHISQFNEEARSPFVRKFKTIIHPGEVNRIRELPQNNNIVATHTDSPDVLIWDVESQPNRHAVLGASDSRPDLVLTGHQDNAEFALAMCSSEPLVLSGGKDKSVVLWSIHDHVSTLATAPGSNKTSVSKAGEGNEGNQTVGPRGIYKGHEDTVEDVQFCPTSAQQFCSVGDDSCLIIWDARVGLTPVTKVEKAHDADIHCVDWNPYDENLILTGSADNSVHMFDRRSLTSGGVGSPVHKFQGHEAPVLCVQWSPHDKSIFGSAAEDGLLNIWDYGHVGRKQTGKTSEYPAGLFFRHAGHRDKVVDFHWNSIDPWTIVSVSDDCSSSGGGGTLQIWRVIDLLYRPEDEVLEELHRFKSHVSNCAPS